MEELFTFNANQLKNITNQTPHPEAPKKFRKRILSAKLSNKLIRIRSNNHQDFTNQSPATKSSKKVTFNLNTSQIKKDICSIESFQISK